MKLKKWAGLLLAGVMLFGLTGCLGNFYTKVLTVEGEEISGGLYLMMQMIAYSEASGKVEDTTADLLTQTIEDQTATEWIKSRTIELCKRIVAIEKICAEKGITLSEENAASVESDMGYWDSVKDYYEPNGIGKETLRRYVVSEYLSNQLFGTLYTNGGELAPTKEEVADYYSQNYAHLRLMLVYLTDLTTGEAIPNEAEVRAAVDAMVAEMKDGKTIQAAAKEDLPKINALVDPTATAAEEAAATEEALPDETAGEETESDELITYYLSYTPDSSGTFTQEFLDGVKAQAIGDVGTYDMSGAIMVYQIIDTFETDAEYEEVRDSVVQEMEQDNYEEYLKGVYESYTVQKVPGAEWFYSPKKLHQSQTSASSTAA
ncbi:MAG: hypothetical protein ACK5L3_03705 [Oscillospiraceae bacterium]